MTIINTVSDSRFSLNGVQYLKNYISAVRGSRVEVFNCYERADVLLPLTQYSQVSLNGTVYGSAPLLQAALLDVIYSRHNLGLEALPDQDNIDIKKSFRYSAGESTTSILDKINNLGPYSVTEKQSVWFVGRERVSILDGTPISGPLVPGDAIGDLDIITANPAIVKYKMINRGKGIYGLGGIQLAASDIELIYSSQATDDELEEDPETDFVSFTLTEEQTISEWLNVHSPAITIQPQDDGYTIFKGFDSEGAALSYLWVGEAGTFGMGQTQASATDFQELQGTAPAPYMPTFHQTLQQNPVTTLSANFMDEGTGILMAVGEGIIKIKYPNGHVLYIQGVAPQGNYSVMIPSLQQDDFFVLRSELKNRWVAVRSTANAASLYVPQLIGAVEILQIGAYNMLYNDFDSLDGFGFNPETGVISGFDFNAGFMYNINFLL